jgi:hypothetical protein
MAERPSSAAEASLLSVREAGVGGVWEPFQHQIERGPCDLGTLAPHRATADLEDLLGGHDVAELQENLLRPSPYFAADRRTGVGVVSKHRERRSESTFRVGLGGLRWRRSGRCRVRAGVRRARSSGSPRLAKGSACDEGASGWWGVGPIAERRRPQRPVWRMKRATRWWRRSRRLGCGGQGPSRRPSARQQQDEEQRRNDRRSDGADRLAIPHTRPPFLPGP